MIGVYVNEHEKKFIDLMLETDPARPKKTGETRSRDMLKSIFPAGEYRQHVAIISTGCGKKVIKGYANLFAGMRYSEKELKKLESLLLISGTSYECKPGKSKVVYWIDNPEKIDPIPLPENVVRHGRSWCEF